MANVNYTKMNIFYYTRGKKESDYIEKDQLSLDDPPPTRSTYIASLQPSQILRLSVELVPLFFHYQICEILPMVSIFSCHNRILIQLQVVGCWNCIRIRREMRMPGVSLWWVDWRSVNYWCRWIGRTNSLWLVQWMQNDYDGSYVRLIFETFGQKFGIIIVGGWNVGWIGNWFLIGWW